MARISHPQNIQTKRFYPKQVVITSDFCGPFAHHYLEIVFSNPWDDKQGQGTFSFHTNKNSFVKNFCMEVDGEKLSAEFYRADTGARIHYAIQQQGIQHATMERSESTSYYVNIGPIPTMETRRITMDLFTTVEEMTTKSDGWFFYTRPGIIVQCKGSLQMPPGAVVFLEGGDSITFTETSTTTEFALTDTERVNISIDFGGIQKPIEIYDAGKRMVLIPTPHLIPLENTLEEHSIQIVSAQNIDLLENLVESARTSQWTVIPKPHVKLSRFQKAFIQFLIDEKTLNLNRMEIYRWTDRIMSYWGYIDSTWCYYSPSFSIVPAKVYHGWEEKKLYQLFCPFLDEIVGYEDMLRGGMDVWTSAKELTPRTRALVVEESEQVKSILGNELEKEKERPFPPTSTEVEFVPYDQGPVPIGGYQGIQSNLDFPEHALQGQEHVYAVVQCRVNRFGVVDSTLILKSANPVLDNAALTALRKTRFFPAMQRDRPVDVWIAIPFHFRMKQLESGDDMQKKTSTELPEKTMKFADRTFKFVLKDSSYLVLEQGFDLSHYTEIEFMSQDHFELLYEHPELIKYLSINVDIGVALNPQKSMWILMRASIK